MLGGSSSSNATLYARGSRADYDAWNMPNWTSQEALQAFIACEDNKEGEALLLEHGKERAGPVTQCKLSTAVQHNVRVSMHMRQ